LLRSGSLAATLSAIHAFTSSSIHPTECEVIWIRIGKAPSFCNLWSLVFFSPAFAWPAGAAANESIWCEVVQRALVDPAEVHAHFASLPRKPIGRWNQA
jgi:hypothetical protein